MTKIGLKVGMCLGNNQGNFHLQRFTIEKISQKVSVGYFFDAHSRMHFFMSSIGLHQQPYVNVYIHASGCFCVVLRVVYIQFNLTL